MGPLLLSEETEREARRVAAAFEVATWQCSAPLGRHVTHFVGNVGETVVEWDFHEGTATLSSVAVASSYAVCSEIRFSPQGRVSSFFHSDSSELMARGLYRLGIEDETVLAELNYSLTFHEKLELRLSMPREFWPPHWRDEEGA